MTPSGYAIPGDSGFVAHNANCEVVRGKIENETAGIPL